MNARQFFYAVAEMRQAQRDYFMTRDPGIMRAAIRLERTIDAEIQRVKALENPQPIPYDVGEE